MSLTAQHAPVVLVGGGLDAALDDLGEGVCPVISCVADAVADVAARAGTGAVVVDVPDLTSVAADLEHASPAWHDVVVGQGHDLVTVRRDGPRVLVGPVTRARHEGCPECLRVRRRRADGRPATRWISTTGAGLAPVQTSLVATLVRCLLTAPRASDRSSVQRVAALDLGTTCISWHRLTPVAGCPGCPGVVTDGPWRARTTATTRRARAGRVSPLPPSSRLRAGTTDWLLGPTVHTYDDDRAALPVAGAEAATVQQSRRDLTFGRGPDRERAAAVALLEAVEREAVVRPGPTTGVRRRWSEVASTAVPLAAFGVHPRPAELGAAYTTVGDDAVLDWVWARSVRRAGAVLVPEHVVYTHAVDPLGRRVVAETANGCAIGSSWEEAVLHGLLEVLERDAFLLAWYRAAPLTRLDLEAVRNPVHARELGLLVDLTRATGWELRAYDVSSELGVPTVWVLAAAGDRTLSAAAADLDVEVAVLRATREVVSLLVLRAQVPPRDTSEVAAMRQDPALVRFLEDHVDLFAEPGAPAADDFARGSRSCAPADTPGHHPELLEDLAQALRGVTGAVIAAGLDVISVDIATTTARRLGLHVAKVLVPGALPLTFGHANRRLGGLPRLPPGRDHRPHPFS